LFGLKPTYGRLSRVGTFPFVASLDHVGPLARFVGDLALSYDAMLGPDSRDPAQADIRAAATSPTLNDRVSGLRIAAVGGYFARSADRSATSAVDTIARALKTDRVVELAGTDRARSAAYLLTMAAGAALILPGCATALKTSIRKFATGLSLGR
jgi:aspartyl-tRNA(Asn)/glutamyl-tRNA(Gln) amidotransferase subunit A